MALIGKIRQKRILLFTVLMLAISLFVIAIRFENNAGSSNQQLVGVINGKEIEYSKFNQKLEFEINQSRSQKNGEQLKDYEITQLRERVWQQYVNENTVLAEAKKLGLAVTDAELVDMVQGRNILDDIKKNFTDPNTGEFNRAKVIEYLKAIDNPDPKNEQLVMMKGMWQNYEKSLPDFRLQEKYTEMFTKSIYVTKAELEKNHLASTAKSVANYVYVPFSTIVDSTVKLTDDKIKEYYNSNKNLFITPQDQAYIDYVQFEFKPSKEDTAKTLAELNDLVEKFQNTTNDSSFVNINSSNQTNIVLVKPNELPYLLTSNVASPEPNKVYGPYFDYSNYKLYKVGPLKDDDLFSIKASHILFKPTDTTEAALNDAKKRAQDVLNRIKSGENFEILAAQYGTDGTKDKGGDLGVFQENQMVPEFNDAVFKKGSVGLLNELVKTQFGYHIIKITEPKSKSKKHVVYSIEKNIRASSQTMDRVVNLARSFKDQLKKSNIDEVLKKPEFAGYSKMSNVLVSKQSSYLGGLTNAESIVRWVYDENTDPNDVSDFRLPTSTVIAVYTNFREKGQAKFEDVKNEATAQAKNSAKGDIIISKIKQLNTKSVEELGNAYGVQAVTKLKDTLSIATSSIAGNMDPIASGRVAGLKVGKKLDAFKGENGVVVAEKISEIPGPELADYTTLKKSVTNSLLYKNMNGITNSLNEILKVEDNRYIFY